MPMPPSLPDKTLTNQQILKRTMPMTSRERDVKVDLEEIVQKPVTEKNLAKGFRSSTR